MDTPKYDPKLPMQQIGVKGIQLHPPYNSTLALAAPGAQYSIDIEVEVNVKEAAKNDQLGSTINYETLHLLARQAILLDEHANMETACIGLKKKIQSLYPEAKLNKLRLTRQNPPLDEIMDAVYIEASYTPKIKDAKNIEDPDIIIGIENLYFFASHGFYEEETILGNKFALNLAISLPESKAIAPNSTLPMLSYETIFHIIQYEMETPSALLEHVVERIVNNIKSHFNFITQLRIQLKKLTPPLLGQVEATYVAQNLNLRKTCPRCEKNFSCYNSEGCACFSIPISELNLKTLKQQYDGCLCPDCLRKYV
jgi:dihydroneopterin aldolase